MALFHIRRLVPYDCSHNSRCGAMVQVPKRSKWSGTKRTAACTDQGEGTFREPPSCLNRYYLIVYNKFSPDRSFDLLNTRSEALHEIQKEFLSLQNTRVLDKETLRRVASAYIDRDSESGQMLRKPDETDITGMRVPPGKNVIVTWGNAGHLMLYEKTFEDRLCTVQGLSGQVSVALSLDSEILAVYTDTSTVIRLYKLPKATLMHAMEGHRTPATGVAWSPDCSVLASVS